MLPRTPHKQQERFNACKVLKEDGRGGEGWRGARIASLGFARTNVETKKCRKWEVLVVNNSAAKVYYINLLRIDKYGGIAFLLFK